MSAVNFDPDIKVKMSLDDIIRLTKPSLMNLKKKPFQNKKRQTKRSKPSDHSVPLASLGGGCIYVTKNSPLLRVQKKRMIQSAALNRMLNSELLNQTKEIIPANYKLFKTSHGVERILVPAEDCIAKLQTVNSPVWKSLQSLTSLKQDQGTQTNQLSPIMDVSVPPPINPFKMEVDDPDDEIIILNTKSKESKQIPVINLELDSCGRFDVLTNKLNSLSKVPKTLNDRFTKLCSRV